MCNGLDIRMHNDATDGARFSQRWLNMGQWYQLEAISYATQTALQMATNTINCLVQQNFLNDRPC